VRRCWASLWTDRAVSYRRHQGIDQQAIKLAVVIQRMVQVEDAGVVFTANPVTGARDEMVVDANPGLGDAVVSGLVTPDHFVLKKRWSGWWIVERRPGKREVIVLPRIEGGTEHISSDRARAPALPDSALLQLVRLCSAIQLHFGSPQDIEWAWSGFGISAPAFDQMFIKKDDVIVQLKHNIAFRPTSGIFLAPARLLRIILHYNPVRWQEDTLLVKIQSHVKDLEARELRTLSWRELLSTLQEAQDIFVDVGELRRRYYPRMGFAAAMASISLLS